MNQRLPILCAIFLLLGMTALAQTSTDVPFQVRYASNLSYADSAVIITNDGASATAVNPVTAALNGNMCVNVYVLDPQEELVSCCSCPVTPDGLQSLSAVNDLTSNTLTPAIPTSIVIKLVATLSGAGGSGTTCANSASVAGSAAYPLAAAGLAAWGTTVHALGPSAVLPPGGTTPPAGTTLALTETPFTAGTLSPSELTRLNTLCGFIQGNATGYGICASCRTGGLGAVSNP
jgi:hypothetical protein